MLAAFPRTSLIALCSLLALCIETIRADGALPDYTVKDYPLANTYYWFSSVEVGVCYMPQARAGSIKGALHCSHQERYDIDNNSFTLPQTCVALKPLGGPLHTAVRDSCTNAKGTFNFIKPAASNDGGQRAYDTIQRKGAGTNYDDQSDTNDKESGGDDEDGSDSKKGGLLGGLFG